MKPRDVALLITAFAVVAAVSAAASMGILDKPLSLLGRGEKGPTLETIDRGLAGGWLVRLANGHSYQVVGRVHCDVVEGKFLRCNFPIRQ